MTTCMVYLRKSTNRKDKQLNTFDEQTIWVNSLLSERPDLEVVGLDGRICEIPQQWFIYEAKSAKQGWVPREKFHQMAELIRKIGIDYLVVWLPDRLSRNTADMNIIIELMGNRAMIRMGIITENNTYKASESKDVDDLEQHLLNSKRENQNKSDRAIKSQKYLKSIWIFPHKFPFWYTNIKNSGALVKMNPNEAQMIRLAYDWVLKWCQWKEISDEFKRNWFHKNGDGIKTIVENSIHYWEFEFEGKMMAIKNNWYIPIIDKPTFDKVQEHIRNNSRRKWKANPLTNGDKDSGKYRNRFFYKMIYDTAGIMLQSYEKIKTGGIFYKNPSKNATYKINISEKKIFAFAEEAIKEIIIPKSFSILIEEALIWRTNTLQKEEERNINIKKGEIAEAEWLINGFMNAIWRTLLPQMIEKYENQIVEKEWQITTLKKELERLVNSKKDFVLIAKKYASYFDDLPWTFKKVSKKEKIDILRGLGIYFIVWPDKTITMMWWDFKKLFNL